MAWQQLIVSSTGDRQEWLSEFLFGHDALTVTIQDALDQPIFEPPPGSMPVWDHIFVIAMYEPDVGLTAVKRQLSSEHFEWRCAVLEDQDWGRAYLDSFQPQRFGDRLWVCPSWTEPPQPDAINVTLDPGLAFGTGSHETTALCLNWLAENDLTGQDVIDFGCGSGILAVAALKLGARHVTAVDIDPQALLATRNNAAQNGVLERLTTVGADDFEFVQVDVLLANILAAPLVELVDQLSACVRSGGSIVLSGILDSQSDMVAEAYQHAFNLDPVAVRGDWVRLCGTRIRRGDDTC